MPEISRYTLCAYQIRPGRAFAPETRASSGFEPTPSVHLVSAHQTQKVHGALFLGKGGKSSNTRLLSHFETIPSVTVAICPVCGGADLDADRFCWDCEATTVNRVLSQLDRLHEVPRS